MSYLASRLFESRARECILRLLLVDGHTLSESEIARRAGLSARSVHVEVERLGGLGLVTVEGIGATNVVRANRAHPAFGPLVDLLRLPVEDHSSDQALAAAARSALFAHGAPLVGVDPDGCSLEEAILRGLEAARIDGTILRVLPVVIAKNASRIDWTVLKDGARRRKLKRLLGMVVDLTGCLVGDSSLGKRVLDLKDRRMTRHEVVPRPFSKFERILADEYSPALLREWGILANLDLASLRRLVQAHGA